MRNFLPIVFAALALAGCRTGSGVKPASPPPAAFTRIASPDSNVVQLQIALRKLVPAHRSGPAIWLAGTMHVGEPEYYQAIQKFLDAQTVVLYEGIHTEVHPRHVPKSGVRPANSPPPAPAAAPATNSADSGYSMQATLAKSLGLVFQLDAIDYDRTNFLNSDLSVVEIQRLMAGSSNAAPAAPGQGGAGNPSFDALLQIMDGSSLLGSLFKVGLQFIGSSPKYQGIAKLTLIETVGRLKGDLSDVRDLPPDLKQLLKVLIAARNENVIADLKTELKLTPHAGSIAIFYGMGHMDDMERRLESELNYRPAEDVWLTAFAVDLHKSGITPGEAQVTRNLVKWQIEQMR